MQQFLQDIQEILPKVTQRKGYVFLCSLQGRSEKYGKFWVGKRDGKKFGISERQMLKLIRLLIDYGFLTIEWEIKGTSGFKCRIFKASKALREIFNGIRGGINISNLTDRIKQFNSNHNTFDYLRNNWKVKGKKLIIEDRYIVYNKWKYKDCVYDSQENTKLTLFEYLRNGEDIIKKCLELKIIW